MNSVKRKLSLEERWFWFKQGLKWCTIPVVYTYHPDEDNWTTEKMTLEAKWDCFLAGLETAVLGYVWTESEEVTTYE